MDVVKARFLALIFLSFALSACAYSSDTASTVFPKTSSSCQPTAVAKQFVVRWKDGTTVVYKNSTREEVLKKVVEPNVDRIAFAEQDQKVSVPSSPEKVSTEAQVAISTNWGQEITQAADAWSQGYNGQGVIVAVVDSGLDRTHDQLKNQLYVNPGEVGTDARGNNKSSNGVDDDSNGYIDDVSGYDFALNSGTVVDGTGHGTHVAGIIAAQHSAGTIQGMAEQAKILPLDFMGDDGSGNISDAIRAMYYAADRGAKIINASWGGAPCSQNLRTAISDIGARGVLFVSASGNSYKDLDSDPEYPAAYGMSTQVTVGSSNNRDYADMFSNYSYSLVNLMAPGDTITSTYPGNVTRVMSGTSMATPFVVGAAAVLWGARPNASVSDVKNALLNSVDAGPFQVSSRGRLNLKKALAEILKLP